MHAQVLLLAIVGSAAGFTPPTSRSFATFGNEQTKALIQAWQPKPLKVPQGEVMTPQGTENMKRFVRARILLEDPSIGGVASFDDKLTIILTRFNKAEHQVWATSALFLRAVVPAGCSLSRGFMTSTTLHALGTRAYACPVAPPLPRAARPPAVAADERATKGLQGLGGVAQGVLWQQSGGAAALRLAPRGRQGGVAGRLPRLSAPPAHRP
jgi:hypothetical protein